MTKSADKLYEQVSVLMKKDRWLEAIKLLKADFSLVKQNWRLSWNLGWCYFNLSRFDDARKHLFHAAKLAPENPICRWALGNVYLKKKQFKKAEVVLTESLKVKESHLTRIALALAYLSQGKVKEAERVHLEGIKLKPGRSDRYESYAAFLSDVGREAEARKMNRRVK